MPPNDQNSVHLDLALRSSINVLPVDSCTHINTSMHTHSIRELLNASAATAAAAAADDYDDYDDGSGDGYVTVTGVHLCECVQGGCYVRWP